MYHPQTADSARHRVRNRIATIVCVLAVIALSMLFFAGAQEAMREQGALSMRTAILDAAKQCCAVEGAYPKSMGYLVDHYGLVVNTNDYLVTYECFADNVIPSVVVVPR